MKVFMLSSPSLNWDSLSEFLSDEGLLPATIDTESSDGALLAEVAGRLCYMSYGKGRKTNKEFIDNILMAQHFSVLEHANWSFIITGVSRSLTHELVRHRHFSFSQLSQRYVDESKAEIVMPDILKTNELEPYLLYIKAESQRCYVELVENLEKNLSHVENKTLRRKMARQAARAVLPNATETKIVVTGNARTWREFIQKRNTEFADPEIRALAAEILRQLNYASPELFGDLIQKDIK